MFGKKTLLAAAALAVLSAAGVGSAAAQPYDHRMDHRGFDRHPGMAMQHRYVDRIRLERALRFHHYRVIGDPYFVRGHYVVRTHDRFGHVVLVRIDPYSGAYLGVFRL